MKRTPTRTIRRRPGYAVAVLTVLTVLAAGCGDADATAADPLQGSRWEMTSVRDGGDLTEAHLTTIATAVFSDGTVSGSNGCNRYQATYSIDGDSIFFGEPAQTGFACDPEYAAQGQAFIAAMQASEHFSVSNARLELADGSTDPQLRFRPAGELPLIGVSWVLTGYAGAEGGMVSPLSETEISINFLGDGTLTGIAGCNSYNAGYRLEGNEITVGDLTRTVIGCVDPDGIMTQERDYLDALDDAGSFATTLTGLELLDSDGTPIAEYRYAGRTR